MTRFVFWILAIGLAVGFGPSLGHLTLRMARAVVHAHRYDQMSYAKFTRTLLKAKPRNVRK
jgi:hypothetical protein